MWIGINRQHQCVLSHNASAAMRHAATIEWRDARCVTQLTVGVLLLKSAILTSLRLHTISSTLSSNSNNPAISKSKFVIISLEFESYLRLFMMSGGHCSWNTIGVYSLFLPMITPPIPDDDASQMPT